jgi:hypothetical protein
MADTKLGRAVLELTTDKTKFNQGLDSSKKDAEGWTSHIGGIAKTAVLGLVGVGVAVAGVLGAAAKEAAEEEVGITRLATAVQNTGGNWDLLSEKIEKTIHAQELQTAFSDNEQRDALSMLVSLTGSVEEGMARLPVAMDLARGANIDLTTASKLLGKVTDENVTVLKRYGISVEKGASATELLGKVTEKFGGQAAAFGTTTAGKMQIVQNEFSNLTEQLGAMVLPMVGDLLTAVLGVIEGLRAFAAQPEVIVFVTAFADGIKTLFGVLGELFGVITGTAPDAGEKLKALVGPDVANIIMGGLATIRDNFKAAFAIIAGVVHGFQTGDFSELLGAVKSGATTMADHLTGIAGSLAKVAESVLAGIVAAAPKIRDQLLAWGKEFFAWVGPATLQLIGNITTMLGQLLGWISDHSEEIGKTLVEWGLKFGEFIFTVVVPALWENLPKIMVTIGTWVLTEAIPGVLRIMAGLGRGIVEGIWAGISSLAGWIGDRLREFVLSTIPEAIRDLLGIHSPSQVMFEIGVSTAEGLAGGIESGTGLVGAAAAKLAGGLVGGITAQLAQIAPGLREAAAHFNSPFADLPAVQAQARGEVFATSWNNGVPTGIVDMTKVDWAGAGAVVPGMPASSGPIVTQVFLDGREIATAIGDRSTSGARATGGAG